jgi:hypothetical protein
MTPQEEAAIKLSPTGPTNILFDEIYKLRAELKELKSILAELEREDEGAF